MTTFDPSKYTNPTPTSQHTGLSVAKTQPENSPVAMVILGGTLLALVASAGSAIPGMHAQYQANQAVQERLTANGLSLLEGKELEQALKDSQPVTAVDKPNELALVSWEEIINNRNFPPGSYLTKNSVIVKAVTGAKGKLDLGSVSGHRIGSISPVSAQKQFTEFQRNMNKINGAK